MKRLLILAVTLLAIGCGSDSGTPAGGRPANPASTQAGPGEKEIAATIDLPLYPGAKVTNSEQVVGGGIPQDEKRYRVTLETADDIDKVIAFYKDKGKLTPNKESESKASVMGTTAKGYQVLMWLDRTEGSTRIAISSIVR